MDNNLKTSIWQQFGASIDYLVNTIEACPDSLWHASLWNTDDKPPELAQFWYVAYHSAFWLNLYLTGAEEGYLPPPPFALIEQDQYGPIPERAYTKAEVLGYIKAGRATCKATIDSLTDEIADRHCVFGWGACSFLELLIYNMRHVHGHASQLNMLLGLNKVATPDYPTRVDP
ncbi:MAG: DinB family protein [Chloroflexi bacterium]|nr:DinB family protein [Chloroflexota bacterium]